MQMIALARFSRGGKLFGYIDIRGRREVLLPRAFVVDVKRAWKFPMKVNYSSARQGSTSASLSVSMNHRGESR